MGDAEFEDPRLAAIYDDLDADRRDLDPYVRLARREGARSVLDLGCGTGVLALRLAALALRVTAIDPAGASIDVARGKDHAEAVTWINGMIDAAPPRAHDLVLMTGNAAQAVVGDGDWSALIAGVRRSLRPGGAFAFETRRPDARAWEGWTPSATLRHADTGSGPVTTWTEVLTADPPLVTFRSTWRFESDGAALTSTSTLRFREEDELRADLEHCGFHVESITEAPDRPGLELVVLARRAG